MADTANNALLIKATLLDLVTIRKLLQTVDADPDTEHGTRSWVLGPFKHAKAEELAKIVREIYREERFSVTADVRTNNLALRCSTALYDDIRRLLTQLDTPKK